MKKFIWLVLFIGFAIPAFAEEVPLVEIPSSIQAHQGMLVRWDNPKAGVQNLTDVTIAKTKADPSFGKWNVLWDGWLLNLGVAYDGTGINTATLMLGRNFGTLGKYLPIDFPLKDKLEFSIEPIGIYVDSPFSNPDVGVGSGISVVKFDVSF